ncbi:hypothetical protein [Lyngbya aestuarii]|uniref:hypothetical protein n=1 Tax=Lyngbya aestuarii TaxID=118322 RepID=UPI00403DDDB7
MRVWMISFLVLFGIVELYQWIRDFTLPLPVFILSGALLAIASNYDKSTDWSWGEQPTKPDTDQVKILSTRGLTNPPNWKNLHQSSSQSMLKTQSSISFTIRRPEPKVKDNDRSG